MVEAEVATRKLVELHGLLGPHFSRVEPFRQAGKYITGLMSDLPCKNAWMIAEHAGMGLRIGCNGCSIVRSGTPTR